MSVNLTHTFEYQHGDPKGLPNVLITRAGKAPDRDGDLHAPRMSTHAEVKIGNVASTGQTTRMTADGMRALAAYLISAADWMDAGLTPVAHAPKFDGGPSLLIVHENGDTYFTGDLDAGKALAEAERYPEMSLGEDGAIHIGLYDDEDRNYAAEWGSGATEEEAWRFALGAFVGPIDDGYDEGRLREALIRGSWSDADDLPDGA